MFGDRPSGAYLHRFAWTRIVRHPALKGGASPDDPALTEYWAERRRKAPLPINPTTLRLHSAQEGRCAICKSTLTAVDRQPQTPREWEQWLTSARNTIIIVTQAPDTPDEAHRRLIHTTCRERHHTVYGKTPAPLPAHQPTGLA